MWNLPQKLEQFIHDKCNSRVTQEITWNHASNKNISWECEECVTTCREQWKEASELWQNKIIRIYIGKSVIPFKHFLNLTSLLILWSFTSCNSILLTFWVLLIVYSPLQHPLQNKTRQATTKQTKAKETSHAPQKNISPLRLLSCLSNTFSFVLVTLGTSMCHIVYFLSCYLY